MRDESLRVVEHLGYRARSVRLAPMSAKVTRFEDLVAWQRAADLAQAVYAATDCKPLLADRALSDQLRRAAVSVPANIAEGFERGTRAQFHHFLSIAKASCAEIRSHIQVGRRVHRIDEARAASLLRQAEELALIIGKLRSVVGRQRGAPTHPSSLVPHT